MTDDSTLPVELGLVLSAAFSTETGETPSATFLFSAAVAADFTVTLPGITIGVHGLEQGVSLGFGSTQTGLAFTGPTWQQFAPTMNFSAALSLDIPAITGSGEVASTADDVMGEGWIHGAWSGGVKLAFASMGIDAFAVIGSTEPLSLAIILCASFPPPGIQIGFGFAVSGVGGVLAVNRRSDPNALSAAVLDGSIDKLLFAHDAQGDAQRIIANLPALFPDSPGQVLAGPMLEITWAAGLVTADVMLIIEFPNPLQVSLIGRLFVDLPFDDDAAVIHLEARIGAFVTPSVPEVQAVASLTGSYIAFIPLTGDLFLLVRGGPEATVIFSAGGFHPAFVPPPNVPPLKRLGMSIKVLLFQLRFASYVAVTTSSVQIGAQVELTDNVNGCGVHGMFGFDALIEWKPQFHFLVSVRIALAVEVFSENLCGVAFSGSLSGPGPWHFYGRAEVEVLGISVGIPIDVTFGSSTPLPPPTPLDVGQLLADELGRPESWSIHPPAAVADGVTLTPTARAALAAAQVLHPGGGLQVTERLLPLGIVVDRYAGQSVPQQTWQITTIWFGDTSSSPTTTVYDNFADGVYTTLTVEQQLSINGFTAQPAGVVITPTGLNYSAIVPAPGAGYDDFVLAGPGLVASVPPLNTSWPLQNPASLVPRRGPAAADTIPGNPISVLAPPPMLPATAADSASVPFVKRESWERPQWQPQ